MRATICQRQFQIPDELDDDPDYGTPGYWWGYDGGTQAPGERPPSIVLQPGQASVQRTRVGDTGGPLPLRPIWWPAGMPWPTPPGADPMEDPTMRDFGRRLHEDVQQWERQQALYAAAKRARDAASSWFSGSGELDRRAPPMHIPAGFQRLRQPPPGDEVRDAPYVRAFNALSPIEQAAIIAHVNRQTAPDEYEREEAMAARMRQQEVYAAAQRARGGLSSWFSGSGELDADDRRAGASELVGDWWDDAQSFGRKAAALPAPAPLAVPDGGRLLPVWPIGVPAMLESATAWPPRFVPPAGFPLSPMQAAQVAAAQAVTSASLAGMARPPGWGLPSPPAWIDPAYVRSGDASGAQYQLVGSIPRNPLEAPAARFHWRTPDAGAPYQGGPWPWGEPDPPTQLHWFDPPADRRRLEPPPAPPPAPWNPLGWF